MAVPTLLLRPEGSRDRSGPVVPTLSAGVAVVAGRYGKAWTNLAGGSGSVPAGYLRRLRGTVLVRGVIHFYATNPTFQRYFVSSVRDATNRMYLGRNPTQLRPYMIVGAPGISAPGYTIADEQPVTLAVRWEEPLATLFFNGAVVVPATAYTGTVADNQPLSLLTSPNLTLESVLVYDTALPDTDIARLSQLPTAWTWASVVPEVGGILRTQPPEPLAIARTQPPEPLVLARAPVPEPVQLARTSPPEPLVISRRPGKD